MPEPRSTSPLAHLGSAIHEIRWKEICPWLILIKALRVTLLIRVLILALLGCWVTQWGSLAINQTFDAESFLPVSITDTTPPHRDIGLVVSLDRPRHDVLLFQSQTGPFLLGWQRLTLPFRQLIDRQLSWQASLLMLLHGGWTIVVWAIFGGAIARIAALYLSRGEVLGPMAAIWQAITVGSATAGAPIIPLLAAMALAVPLVLLGLLLHLPSMAILTGFLWIVVLSWGFLLALILLGLFVGWPLMWACLAVERSDAFDGVSRCYAYVYQKPLQLLLYILIATLLGFLGETVIQAFAAATVTLSEWTLTWGAGNRTVSELLSANASAAASPPIHFWKECLVGLTDAYPVACLWPFAVGIYLLQRSHVDGTELDEVVLTDGTRQAGLPKTDQETPAVPHASQAKGDSDTEK